MSNPFKKIVQPIAEAAEAAQAAHRAAAARYNAKSQAERAARAPSQNAKLLAQRSNGDAPREAMRTEAETRQAERERCKAIINSGEARTRAQLAAHLAFETSTEASTALAMLRAAEPEPRPESGFERAMRQGQNPEVGAGGADTREPTTAERILQSYHLASGLPVSTR